MSGTTTLVACLTPPGVGAIAVPAVRGPAALELTLPLFRPAKSGSSIDPISGRFHLGHFGADLADQVVLSIKRTDPTPWLELHCHGGRRMVAVLLETLQNRGARVCSWQEFQRAGSDEPWRALAENEIVRAPTLRTAEILLTQLEGAFAAAWNSLLDARREGDHERLRKGIATLHRFVGVGRHLTHPWRLTIAGAPNVGKSSLVNALAGFQRSIVAPTPGTTRDVVQTILAIDGWPVEVADTAGLRSTDETLEVAGIQLAREAARSADLCLWVVDVTATPIRPELPPENYLLVANKCDLPATWDLDSLGESVRVSAATGSGLAELCLAVSRRLVPDPPSEGDAVPFTQELVERVVRLRKAAEFGNFEEVGAILDERGTMPGE